MSDDVLTAFLRRNQQDVAEAVAASDVLYLAADVTSGDPARRIHGLFTDVEHFTRAPGDTFSLSRRPLPFLLHYPDDYCSCSDGTLQLRVARVLAPIAHPNIGPGGIVCLGPTFRPSTRLCALLEHVHRICSGRVFASDSPWEAKTAELYRRDPERIRALRAAPLWRQPVAQRVRVESLEPGSGGAR